jgi:hypothetical protein
MTGELEMKVDPKTTAEVSLLQMLRREVEALHKDTQLQRQQTDILRKDIASKDCVLHEKIDSTTRVNSDYFKIAVTVSTVAYFVLVLVIFGTTVRVITHVNDKVDQGLSFGVTERLDQCRTLVSDNFTQMFQQQSSSSESNWNLHFVLLFSLMAMFVFEFYKLSRKSKQQ